MSHNPYKPGTCDHAAWCAYPYSPGHQQAFRVGWFARKEGKPKHPNGYHCGAVSHMNAWAKGWCAYAS